ncbi:MAG: ABC transporter ATP-binding protein, partial [Pseudomonadota bacterium]
ADRRRAAAEQRRALQPLKKDISSAEDAVERHTARIADLDQQLADPSLYETDPAKATELHQARADSVKALQKAEEQWLEYSSAYEEALASLD